MDGLGRTPIPGQKQLRGKTIKKPVMTSSIKRALAVHSRENGREQRTC